MQAGDRDGDGLYVGSDQLQLNGGAIRHATTEQDADLTHAQPGQNGDFPNHRVDGSLGSTSLPPEPTNLTATGQDLNVRLAWDAPALTSDVTHHEYRHKKMSETEYPETWTEIADSAQGEDNEDGFTVTSLTNGIAYDFQVRAVNEAGASDPSDEASAVSGAGLGICDCTRGIQVAIHYEIPGVDDCADATARHLSDVVDIVFADNLPGGLKAGDFVGLSSTTLVSVYDSPQLTELPDGIFNGLSSVSTISLPRLYA